MSERPYWFPVLCDAAYFADLRKDYPEKAHLSDEELHDYFNDGLKYQNLWDHVGDAYGDYEPLADSYLELLKALKLLHAYLFGPAPAEPRHVIDDMCRAAIAKATGTSS